MLVLTRRPGESIIIALPTGERVTVTVLGLTDNQVRRYTPGVGRAQAGCPRRCLCSRGMGFRAARSSGITGACKIRFPTSPLQRAQLLSGYER